MNDAFFERRVVRILKVTGTRKAKYNARQTIQIVDGTRLRFDIKAAIHQHFQAQVDARRIFALETKRFRIQPSQFSDQVDENRTHVDEDIAQFLQLGTHRHQNALDTAARIGRSDIPDTRDDDVESSDDRAVVST